MASSGALGGGGGGGGAAPVNEQNKQEFLQYLTQYEEPSGKLDTLLNAVYPEGTHRSTRRLLVDVGHLRAVNPDLAGRVLRDPNDFLPDFRAALRQAMCDRDEALSEMPENVFQVGFDGNLAGNHTSPRGLAATMLRELVRVDGIVTKCSLVRPKLAKSVHYCDKTGKTISREYRDALASDARSLPTGSAYPTKDDEGNLYTTEFGHCVYTDYQLITVQEMPERSPPGQLPRSVDVVVENDLVDFAKPGDRIAVLGVYRALPNKANGSTSGVFRTLIIANSLKRLGKEEQSLNLTDGDRGNIRDIAKRGDVIQLLSRSVAPSICGHEKLKQALLLVLLGGEEKNLENGAHLRGDLNMLMVGDPSTAKSQLLRFVLHTAPLAINTTGRGSSGVGLTAAVTRDQDTGERRLEAGAMVLADRGVVCIDEFDKMNDADRAAIHEVMEQQTVTIAKAGIHASLNARCSVVAAANPVFGRYDPKRNAEENVNLPDSLLSRFDFLFVVLDAADPQLDRKIAGHVLRMHMFRAVGPDGVRADREIDDNLGVGAEGDAEAEADETAEAPVYQKYDRALSGARQRKRPRRGARGNGDDDEDDVLSIAFLKKYIRYAKKRVHPEISDEANDYIMDQYAALRTRQEDKTSPITVRTLETLIRVSTAVAKARLSMSVSLEDATLAYQLVSFALFHDASGDDNTNNNAGTGNNAGGGAGESDGSDGSGGDDDDDDDDDDNYSDGGARGRGARRRSAGRRGKGRGPGSSSSATPSASKSRARRASQRTQSSAADAGSDDSDDGGADAGLRLSSDGGARPGKSPSSSSFTQRKKKQRRGEHPSSSGASASSPGRVSRKRRAERVSSDVSIASALSGRTREGAVDPRILAAAKKVLHGILNQPGKPPRPSCTKEEFKAGLAGEVGELAVSDAIVGRILAVMEQRNEVMVTQTEIFRV